MNLKKYFILLLIMLCIFSGASAKTYELIQGEFEWASYFENKNIIEKYYYSDAYFINNSGKNNNEHLRTMAMNLVLSSSPALGKSDPSINTKELLNQIGFNDIEVYDYYETNIDSIGTIISHKKIESYDIIMIVLRGNKYTYEWVSNMKAGNEGNIEGFNDACIKILKRLKEYMELYKINSKTKILVTGYSRAGAISNLIGVYLNNHLDEFNLQNDNDIYVYTFEAPNSSNNRKIYKNIHNIVNKNDIITYVYPSSWDVQNNGVKEEIGNDDLLIETYYLNLLKIIGGNNIIQRKTNQNDEIDTQKLNEFLDNLIKWIVDSNSELDIQGLNRNEYASVLQDYICKFIKMFLDKNINDIERIINFFKDNLVSSIKKDDTFYSTIFNILYNNSLTDNDVKSFSEYLVTILEEFKNNNYSVLNDEEYTLIFNFLRDDNVLKILRDIVNKSLNDDPKLYHLVTFLENSNIIFKQHDMKTNYELVKNLDSYYNSNLYKNNNIIIITISIVVSLIVLTSIVILFKKKNKQRYS